MSKILKGLHESRSDWDSNMPGYQGDYGGAANWGRRNREDDEHHEIDAVLAARHAQRQEYERNGKFWLKLKDSQRHLPAGPFIGKQAANVAAVELLKQQPELKGNLLITAYGPDETQGVAEGQLDELSNKTLASYKKKAGADASQADKRGDYARGDKRMSGIIKATKKEFDNDAKGVAEGIPDVDHMHGPRGIGLDWADTRDLLQKPFEHYGNYKEWYRDVNRVNSELLDDNAEFSTMAGGKIISINGKDFAFWSNRNGNGSIDIGIAKKHSGQGVAEGSINEGQYEMMMRNGQVKKFIAKDDADAKRIAAGHGAKSVIKLRGGVPAGKVSEQGVAEGSIGDKIKGAAKSVKRASQGWGIGGEPDMVTPAGAVKAFKDMDGQRLANFVASRKDLSKPRKGSARAFADKVIDREMKQRGYGRVAGKDEQGVAEGSLNEFAPDGFNGGDDGDGFDPDIAKMAQDDGFTKGVSLADGATLERAMAINYWHKQHGGMYKQYFAKGFKEGRLNKIKHDNRQYNLNLKLMKDGSIRHGEQDVSEEKQRLDPSCWKGYKKQGTKMKGDTRVNNCVPVKESAIMKGLK